MTRALILTRLSRVTEATTSPQRQRETCERVCAERGWDVVGVAEDLDVSGSVSPFDRAALRPWLSEPRTFDIVVFYRVDRLTRSLRHLLDVIEWADENDVNLVSATEPFDTSTAMGALVPKITAMVAELELDAISTRNADAFNKHIQEGRYRGGNPPLGYRPEKVDGVWRYVHDPEMAPLAKKIVGRVIDGEPVTSIVRELNGAGVVSPQDHFRLMQGKGYKVDKETKQPKPGRWTVSNLIRQLESPTLLGYAMRSKREKGKSPTGRKNYGPKEVITSEDGRPVVRAEPIIDRATFDRLQDALRVRRTTSPKRRKSETALLLQVAFCALCERPMYRIQNSRPRSYYRCGSVAYHAKCDNRTAHTDFLDALVSERLLELLGDVPHTLRVFEPGDDTSGEIDEIDRLLENRRKVSVAFEGEQLDAVIAEIHELNSRRAELQARPFRAPGYRYEPTGQTFGEYWESLDVTGRNQWLRDHGVRVTWKRLPDSGPEWHLTFGDVAAMVRAVDPNLADRITEDMKPGEIESMITGETHTVDTYEPEMPPGWSADVTRD